MNRTIPYNEDYQTIKNVIQKTHLYPEVKRSVVDAASRWASNEWGKNMDYRIILGYLGVKIIED